MSRYSNGLFDRYLAVLGVGSSVTGIEGLQSLTSAQLIRAPFENISKIVRVRVQGARWIPELEQYLDDIESGNFGGTCNTNNYFFNQLLSYLGYDAVTCGAQIAMPGTSPTGHMVNLIKLEGREWLVDVGYGAPFWYPIPRENTEDVAVTFGEDRYLIKPLDCDRCTRVEVYHKGNLVHGYLMRPKPIDLEGFRSAIEESYRDGATFLNRLRVCKFFADHAVTLNNNSIVEMEATSATTQKIDNREALIETIITKFEMPRETVTLAVDALPDEAMFGK